MHERAECLESELQRRIDRSRSEMDEHTEQCERAEHRAEEMTGKLQARWQRRLHSLQNREASQGADRTMGG